MEDTLHPLFRLSILQVEMILDIARAEGWTHDASRPPGGGNNENHWYEVTTLLPRQKQSIQRQLDEIAAELGIVRLALAKYNRRYAARYNRHDGAVCHRVAIQRKLHAPPRVLLDGEVYE